jgi:hypothetical protein
MGCFRDASDFKEADLRNVWIETPNGVLPVEDIIIMKEGACGGAIVGALGGRTEYDDTTIFSSQKIKDAAMERSRQDEEAHKNFNGQVPEWKSTSFKDAILHGQFEGEEFNALLAAIPLETFDKMYPKRKFEPEVYKAFEKTKLEFVSEINDQAEEIKNTTDISSQYCRQFMPQ